MTADVFFNYISTVFYPWLVENKIVFPVILYIDGHSSHVTMEVSDFCVQKQIELILLYLNATHILQPMDVAVFRSMKAKYRKAVQEWKFENCEAGLTKYSFAGVLKKAIDSMDIEKILQNGFKACWVLPI